MKRFCLICLMGLTLLMTGCATGPESSSGGEPYEEFITVGFSQVGAESDWRNANTKSMKEALSEENGFRLILDDAQQKQERQITAIRNFIQQEVDYIVLAPTKETGWDTVLAEARAAGIDVIVVDRMIEVQDGDLFTCWVGSDFRAEGNTAVEWMERYAGDRPLRIVHLQGSMGSSAQIGRTEALDEALKRHENWTLVTRESGEFTLAKGQELMEAVLEQGLEFDVVYSENDNMAYGVIDALEAAGRQPGKDVIILSFDASHRALEMMLEGKISLDVECNPLHGPRVRALIEQLEAGQSPAKLTFVEETFFEADTLDRETLDAREY